MNKLYLLFITLLFTVVLVACGNNEEEKLQYGSDLLDVTEKILENASNVEELLDQYANVWRYSIETTGGIKVEDLVQRTGLEETTVVEYFVEPNFTGSYDTIYAGWESIVRSMHYYYSDTGKLDDLNDLSEEIQSEIQALNNPPEEFKQVYDEVIELYTLGEEYIQMAINPSGSLVSFNEDRNRLSTDIVSQVNRIEAIMPIPTEN